MSSLFEHAWGTPLPQLTLVDVGVAATTLILFSLVVEAIGFFFRRPEAADEGSN